MQISGCCTVNVKLMFEGAVLGIIAAKTSQMQKLVGTANKH